MFERQRRWHDRWFSFKMQNISGTRLVSNSFRFIWICESSLLSVKWKAFQTLNDSSHVGRTKVLDWIRECFHCFREQKQGETIWNGFSEKKSSLRSSSELGLNGKLWTRLLSQFSSIDRGVEFYYEEDNARSHDFSYLRSNYGDVVGQMKSFRMENSEQCSSDYALKIFPENSNTKWQEQEMKTSTWLESKALEGKRSSRRSSGMKRRSFLKQWSCLPATQKVSSELMINIFLSNRKLTCCWFIEWKFSFI